MRERIFRSSLLARCYVSRPLYRVAFRQLRKDGVYPVAQPAEEAHLLRFGSSFLEDNRQMLRDIERNPRVGLHLNSDARGGDVTRLEGVAEIALDAPHATEAPGYVDEYRESIARVGFDEEGFARAYPVAVRVTPERWPVW